MIAKAKAFGLKMFCCGGGGDGVSALAEVVGGGGGRTKLARASSPTWPRNVSARNG